MFILDCGGRSLSRLRKEICESRLKDDEDILCRWKEENLDCR